jgi:drug/metabolite transporter (DMT)-like permease
VSPRGNARPLAVGAALLAVYTVWGSTYLGIRFAEETMPGLLMGCLRYVVAGTLLLGWGLLRAPRGQRRPSAAHWRSAAIVGAALLLAGNGGVIWAETRVSSGVVALLVALVPLHMAWLDRVFYRQPASRWTVLGIVAGLAGLAVLAQPGGSGRVDLAGVGAVVFGSFCWAAGSLYARTAPHPRSAALGSGMQMLAGGALLGLAGLLDGEAPHVHPAAVSLKSALAVAYLVVFGSLLAFSAYAWLIRNARTSLVSTYAYVNPVVAVVLGAAFASEPITARTLVAGAIILSGVALIVARPAARPAPRATATAEPAAPAAAPAGAAAGAPRS